MAERPILFTPENAEKVHLGLKTQTRRVIIPQLDIRWNIERTEDGSVQLCRGDHEKSAACDWETFKPQYSVGDRLWVRESWGWIGEHHFEDLRSIMHRGAQGSCRPFDRWRNAMFMPRWASRTTLEVLEVRAERVGDISEEDAKAEGILEPAPVHGEWCDPKLGREGHWSYRKPFADLWDSINGKKPGCNWKSNPWVWAYTFRKEPAA